MNTLLSALTALFASHAQPVDATCYVYQGNWVNAPTSICGSIQTGAGHVSAPPSPTKKPT